MPDLAESQHRFAQALDGAHAPESCAQLFIGSEQDVARRLAVYQANRLATGSQALAAAYPVIGKVVGTEFFEAMARVYLTHSPSASGDLNEYGVELPAFLEGFVPVRELPYLPDLARLEWAVHRAHFSADSTGLDLARLAAVTQAQQPSLHLKLNPLCAVFESRYPLAQIWEIHQAAHTGEFSVQFEGGPFHALVSRPRFRAQAGAIGGGEYAFLAATASGANLSDALDRALRADPAFALDAALRAWVEALVVTDFFF
jgi:uncharacterized protein